MNSRWIPFSFCGFKVLVYRGEFLPAPSSRPLWGPSQKTHIWSWTLRDEYIIHPVCIVPWTTDIFLSIKKIILQPVRKLGTWQFVVNIGKYQWTYSTSPGPTWPSPWQREGIKKRSKLQQVWPYWQKEWIVGSVSQLICRTGSTRIGKKRDDVTYAIARPTFTVLNLISFMTNCNILKFENILLYWQTSHV